MKTNAPTTPAHGHSPVGLDMPPRAKQINGCTDLGSDVVTKDQKYRRSLTMATGTQFHDQPLGPQASQEFIFGWLDTVLGV